MFRNNYYRHYIVEVTFREKTEHINYGGKGHFKITFDEEPLFDK